MKRGLGLIKCVGLFLALVVFNLAEARTPDARIVDVRATSSVAGMSFDLVFSQPYSAKNIAVSKERNFVQAVAKNAKMNSGKTLALRVPELEKVFAYPFAKNTSRIRIIARGQEPPEGTVSVWNTSNNVVRIFLKKNAPSEVVQTSKRIDSAAGGPAVNSEKVVTRDAALAEVLAKTAEIDLQNPDSVVKPKNETPITNTTDVSSIDKQERKQVGTKSDPSRHFLRMFLVLGGVLGLFGAGVFLLKRYASRIGKLPFGKKERLIQVVATHYLGNKKSIALVKVTGEYMVVGVSNENISLISKIGAEVAVDKFLEERFWNGTFEKHLTSYAKDPVSQKLVDLSDDEPKLETKEKLPLTARYDGPKDFGAGPQDALMSATERTRDRVEISRAESTSTVRTGIREKLTNLKPLN